MNYRLAPVLFAWKIQIKAALVKEPSLCYNTLRFYMNY